LLKLERILIEWAKNEEDDLREAIKAHFGGNKRMLDLGIAEQAPNLTPNDAIRKLKF